MHHVLTVGRIFLSISAALNIEFSDCDRKESRCAFHIVQRYKFAFISQTLLYVVEQGDRGVRHDLKIGRNIIGEPKMPPATLRKEDSQPSRRDGKMNPHVEKHNRYIDGLSSTASFWTSSTQSTSVTRLPEKNELDTTINTH